MQIREREVTELFGSTYNNQLRQSIHLCHKGNMSQISQPLSNVPIKYQLATLYGFRDIAQTKF